MTITNILIQQQISRYRADAARWTTSVRNARTALDAFALARREPMRGPLIRGTGSMTNQIRAAALREIDRLLSSRLVSLEEHEKVECLRRAPNMTDFPSVTRWMREEQHRAIAAARNLMGG